MRPSNTLRLCVFIAAILTVFPGFAAAQSKTTVVISDTHFGLGRRGTGEWTPFEDFRWADDFEAFLQHLEGDFPPGIDLVLNGDTFELWQFEDAFGAAGRCPILDDRRLGCTESQGQARLTRILGAHERELSRLQAFTAKGNRAFIVPGNHDAALLFPGVRKLISDKYPALTVVEAGFWRSEDSKILIEHGHQIGVDVNAFSAWPKPFVSVGSGVHLERTGGEQFVTAFYNAYEEKYPTIDNITDEGAAVSYAIAREGAPGVLTAAGGFLRFLLLNASWPQRAAWLGSKDGKAPHWSLENTRQGGNALLATLLPGQPPVDLLPKIGLNVADISDEDLEEICNRAHAYNVASGTLGSCPRKDMGASLAGLVRKRDEELTKYLRNRAQAVPGFMTYVYSHTHRAEEAFKPVRDAWSPYVINTGAWQRVITPANIEKRLKSGALKREDVLKQSLEDLPACYTYVVIRSGSDRPELRNFAKVAGKLKASKGACP